ncbi:MAG: hypothetical protein N3C62_03630 [Synergistetes bacterium]|nr:hypothetical protein [Synergistota bacterium]MCX8127817.1 hypothetical protein [Synergistota bacterium]MDW8192079.1 hypothetical protein [Synergistota bacterium]
MKAFLIVGNSTLEEDIKILLERLKVDGYTQWSLVKGKGDTGFHLGTPIWPALNEAFLVVAEGEKEKLLLEALKDMRKREQVREEGLEVFFWEVGRVE